MDKKLNEIKTFIHKTAAVMEELAQAAEHSKLYSLGLSDEIIEQQQDLRRHARRIGVICVEKPFFEEAEFQVLIRFGEFSSFVNLDECKKTVSMRDDVTHYLYSIIMDNIILQAIKTDSNEEHKKAQAI
ncbi:MAG: hypothetical protein ABS944_16180 [Solibacillus sp.]|uniref:hypothetical protein n=1 Tax=Solibacillus sp. TaxID=1909654 RepID=UPI00331571F9